MVEYRFLFLDIGIAGAAYGIPWEVHEHAILRTGLRVDLSDTWRLLSVFRVDRTLKNLKHMSLRFLQNVLHGLLRFDHICVWRR